MGGAAFVGPRRAWSPGRSGKSPVAKRRRGDHNGGSPSAIPRDCTMKHKSSKGATPRSVSSRSPGAAPRVVLKLAALVVALIVVLLGGQYLWQVITSSGSPEARLAARDKTPPKLNPFNPPGPAPEGMVWIPGGEFWMGAGENVDSDNDSPDDLYMDAREVHRVYVAGFWMDKTELTNAQFAKFVEATSYKTIAEKEPDPKDFPN